MVARRRPQDENAAPVWIATVVSLVVRVISFFLTRALGRCREYAAIGMRPRTGRPGALASALLTIFGRMDDVPADDLRKQAERNAFRIIPYAGTIARFDSTHPLTENRLEQLRLEREAETSVLHDEQSDRMRLALDPTGPVSEVVDG